MKNDGFKDQVHHRVARTLREKTLASHSDPSTTRIVLYDGVCNLCNASIRFIVNRDQGRLYRFAHLQSKTGKRLAEKYGIDLSTTDSFVLINKGQASIKSDAWLSVLESLGGFWRIARVFRYVPRPIRDALYDVVGQLRYRVFGKTSYCQIPTPAARNRFLDCGASFGEDRG